MGDLDTQMEKGSNNLLHVISVLSSALIFEEVLAPKIDGFNRVGPAEDVVLSRTKPPAPTDAFEHSFDAKNAQGEPSFTEAVPKQSVLSSDN